MVTGRDLEQKLATSIEAHGIPGAQLAVLDGDTVTEAAAGVLSRRTGQPATTDSLFLPGSIGKSYTATLVMTLVDEGKLDLDVPIVTYLPQFRTKDQGATRTVTARHLLSHTSGFDGDHFEDTGRGDDALTRYVDGCAELPQIAPPGLIWSYSNSGYAILGRVVEVLTGQVFEDALRDRIFAPLGVTGTVSFADQAIVHPTAVGHVSDPDNPEQLTVSPQWGLFRSFSAMGTAVIATAADVLAFGRMHIDGGVSATGSRILSQSSVESMQVQQIELVDKSLIGNGWGLGWCLDDWQGVRVIGHDGNSIGQNAFMRIAPEQRFGFCLQTNVGSAITLYVELANWLFGERLGVTPPPKPEAVTPSPTIDTARYAGKYRREGVEFDVTAGGTSGLQVSVRVSRDVASEGMPPMEDLPLQPAALADAFLLKLPIADEELVAAFFRPDEPGGRPTYVHFGGRAHKRVA